MPKLIGVSYTPKLPSSSIQRQNYTINVGSLAYGDFRGDFNLSIGAPRRKFRGGCGGGGGRAKGGGAPPLLKWNFTKTLKLSHLAHRADAI